MQPTKPDIIDIAPLPEPGPDRALTRREETVRPGAAPPPAAQGWALIVLGVLATVGWPAAAGAFVVGFHGWEGLLALRPGEQAGYAFIIFGPSTLIWALAISLRLMLRIHVQADRFEAAAEKLRAPLDRSKAEARSLAEAMTDEIGRINRAAEGGLARLAAMEEVLRHHARTLAQADEDARGRTDALIRDLKDQREGAVTATAALETRARMLIDVGERIETAAERVETLAARAREETLGAVAAADEGGQALERFSRELAGKREQLADLFEAERGRVAQAAQELAEERRNFSDGVKGFAQSTTDMREAAHDTLTTLNGAADAALAQARRLADVIRSETSGAAEDAAQRMADLRAALDEAAQSMTAVADRAGAQVETLNEYAFDAASNADTLFEARMNEARKLVDRANALAEETSAAVAARIEAAAEGWAEKLAGFERRTQAALAAPSVRPPPGQPTAPAQTAPEPLVNPHAAAQKSAAPPAPRPGVPRPPYWAVRQPPPASNSPNDAQAPVRRPGAPIAPDPARQSVADDRVAPFPRQPARARPPAAKEGWSWKDLLASIDPDEDDRELAAPEPALLGGVSLEARLAEAGVDPGRVLDRDARLAAARGRARNGPQEARGVTRRRAGAAVEFVEQLLADAVGLAQAARAFVAEHGAAIDAAVQNRDARRLEALIDGDEGASFLLLDAAFSEG
ncbi:MAG: hypothetical protein ACFB2Z_09765 [Maricaulaceae bacterium]